MSTAEEKVVTPVKTKSLMDEDWAVVVLGFSIILLFLVGADIPAPAYKWSNAQDFTDTILSAGNLLRMGAQFILVFVFSIIAFWITS